MIYDVDYEVIDLVDYYNYNNEYLQVYGVDTIFSVLEDDNFSNTIKKLGTLILILSSIMILFSAFSSIHQTMFW